MNTTIISIVIILIILSIFLFINFDYKSKYKKSEKDLYYEALDLLLLGKLKEAYATLLALIKNDTENVKAYLKLGQVLREIGKPDKALKVHRSLLIRRDLTNYEKIELYKSIALDYKNLILHIFHWSMFPVLILDLCKYFAHLHSNHIQSHLDHQ